MNETVNVAIKQQSGTFVRTRTGWKKLSELVIQRVVHNIDPALS